MKILILLNNDEFSMGRTIADSQKVANKAKMDWHYGTFSVVDKNSHGEKYSMNLSKTHSKLEEYRVHAQWAKLDIFFRHFTFCLLYVSMKRTKANCLQSWSKYFRWDDRSSALNDRRNASSPWEFSWLPQMFAQENPIPPHISAYDILGEELEDFILLYQGR